MAMRTSKAFALGAIMGAAVVWLWGRPMERYVERKTRRARLKVIDGVRAAAETTGQVLDRGGATEARP
jgi:hypothetical protein